MVAFGRDVGIGLPAFVVVVVEMFFSSSIGGAKGGELFRLIVNWSVGLTGKVWVGVDVGWPPSAFSAA